MIHLRASASAMEGKEIRTEKGEKNGLQNNKK